MLPFYQISAWVFLIHMFLYAGFYWIFLSFLLIRNWNDKYVRALRSSFQNHIRFQTKMGKIYTRFQTKTVQKTPGKNPTR